MPKYIVIDVPKVKLLFIGNAENPTEAMRCAKNSEDYDWKSVIVVHEVKEEFVFPSLQHAVLHVKSTEKPEEPKGHGIVCEG
jgi:hypothetical protein